MFARTAGLVAVALTCLVLVPGCGEDGEDGAASPASSADNVFQNGSFEEGKEPWFSLVDQSDDNAWVKDFELSGAQAHSGDQSAFVQLSSEDEGPLEARRYGVVQEVTPQELPETIEGCYYVERWEQGTPRQYGQVAVIVFESDTVPNEFIAGNNFQLRYVLFGVQNPPVEIGNAKFVMVGRGEPETGEWVCFTLDVREDFEALWGVVPAGFQKIRVLFEVNWDLREPTDPPAAGDVYYDDLYFGPG
jgi:hypothetical protein